jgi:hypothetical protein
VGWTVAAVMHDLGLSANSRSLESAFGAVAAVLTAAAGMWLLYRTRIPTLAFGLGVLLVVAAAGGPAAWPWYFTWGLVLLAAWPGPQRSAGLAVALALAVFLVKPNGILALPLGSAPAVLAVYAVVAFAAWYWHRRRDGDSGAAGRPSRSLADSAPSALART